MLFERDIAMKNLYPKIEQTVTIGGVTVGDKDSIKFNGMDLTPKMTALLTSWYTGKVKVKLTLQPVESVMFTADDIKDEMHPMEKPQAKTDPKKKPDEK